MQICLSIACRAPRTKPSCPKSVKTRAANLSTISRRQKKMAQEERRGGPSEEEGPRMRDECREISFVAEFRHFVNLKKKTILLQIPFFNKEIAKISKIT